jgi:6-phosphogluconolactonase
MRPLDQTFQTTNPPPNATLLYVGTYTGGKSKGIYYYRLRTDNLEVSQNITLVPHGLAAETPNPSFLEIDSKRRLVFAVNEVNRFEGKPGGSVSAFSVDAVTGRLTLLNQRPSMGAGPCHLVLDREGKNLLVANYDSGSVSVLPVQADGRLGEATAVVQHTGKSVNPERQSGPHAHCVTLDSSNRFAFVCDLGLDKVLAYRFDSQQGKLTPHAPPFTGLKPGAGPRHMAFRPDGRFAYVINELDSTITSFAYDADAGRLGQVETVSTLPPYFDGMNTAAEIGVHPSGKCIQPRQRNRSAFLNRPGQRHAHLHRRTGDRGKDSAAFRNPTLGEASHHLQSKLGHAVDLPDRRREWPTEALRNFRGGPYTGLCQVSASQIGNAMSFAYFAMGLHWGVK